MDISKIIDIKKLLFLSGRPLIKTTHKPKIGVGVDIGGFSVKLVELNYDKQNVPTLVNAGVFRIPAESKSASKDALKSLLDNLHIGTTDVNISLSGPSVIVRYIQMPLMSEEELKSAIKFEAEKYIPFNINDVIIDNKLLSSLHEDKKMRVLLVAAKKDLIDSRILMLQEVGLTPKTIDIDSFCIINSFLYSNPNIDKEKNVAILDIGSAFSEINIIRGQEPYFTRSIQIAGKDITNAISENLKMDITKAYDMKHDYSQNEDEVFEAMKPVLFELVSEIRLSFSYYENQFGRGVEEVYVTGGTAKFPKLVVFLSENLGVKTQRWDPLGCFNMAPSLDKSKLDDIRDQMAVSVGLALRK